MLWRAEVTGVHPFAVLALDQSHVIRGFGKRWHAPAIFADRRLARVIGSEHEFDIPVECIDQMA